ncbi:MAG: RNA polymerase sigma factor [Oscillospiraceae bacterium]
MGDKNSNSVESIIKKYGDTVYKIAFSMTKNKSDADDIFQEVFLKYLRYSNEYEFDNEEHLKRWLIKVCVNCGKDMLSSSWNKNISTDDDENYIEIKDDFNMEDNSTISVDLKNALNQLPPKYRTVIYLFYFEQLSTKEIAKAIGSNSALVRVYLSRARKILKEILGGEYSFE